VYRRCGRRPGAKGRRLGPERIALRKLAQGSLPQRGIDEHEFGTDNFGRVRALVDLRRRRLGGCHDCVHRVGCRIPFGSMHPSPVVPELADAETNAGARHFCELARSRRFLPSRPRGLVAGSGTGHEAVFLQQRLQCELFAVDLSQQPDDLPGSERVHFSLGDVRELPFPSDGFDFVFSYHVIEHVPRPETGIGEMTRVLKPGGVLYIGTPNRRRIVGYVGGWDASTWDKVRWNVTDYKARLSGRFRNEYGEHAGFTEEELTRLLDPHVSRIEWITADYLRSKYERRLPGALLSVITRGPVLRYVAPALYALCWK
jgi:SAM-dependent methyltransferase